MTTDQEQAKMITLADGRRRAYAECGNLDAVPMIYFHGVPSSRLEPALRGYEALAGLRLRIIAPGRPDVGGSDFQVGRGFSDWPKDVLFLADALGLGQFAVLGNSGGRGYALACVARIAERLGAVVIVSGAWQMNLPETSENLPLEEIEGTLPGAQKCGSRISDEFDITKAATGVKIRV